MKRGVIGQQTAKSTSTYTVRSHPRRIFNRRRATRAEGDPAPSPIPAARLLDSDQEFASQAPPMAGTPLSRGPAAAAGAASPR
jgi:hypothetical protein